MWACATSVRAHATLGRVRSTRVRPHHGPPGVAAAGVARRRRAAGRGRVGRCGRRRRWRAERVLPRRRRDPQAAALAQLRGRVLHRSVYGCRRSDSRPHTQTAEALICSGGGSTRRHSGLRSDTSCRARCPGTDRAIVLKHSKGQWGSLSLSPLRAVSAGRPLSETAQTRRPGPPRAGRHPSPALAACNSGAGHATCLARGPAVNKGAVQHAGRVQCAPRALPTGRPSTKVPCALPRSRTRQACARPS